MESFIQPHPPSPKLPLYLGVLVIVISGLSIIAAGVRGLAWSRAEITNLFDSYADLFPGQPSSAIEARGWYCPLNEDQDSSYYRVTNAPCLLPETSTLSYASLVFDQRHIGQIAFTVRENTLRVGDLMLLWGQPEVRTYNRLVFLYWHSRDIFALVNTNNGQFSLSLPVWRVYFTSFNE